MKPLISNYPGAKNGNGTYHNIINLIPKCDVFFELMAGSAAISNHLHLPNHSIINDIDSNITNKLKLSELNITDLTSSNSFNTIVRHNSIKHNIYLYNLDYRKFSFYTDRPYKVVIYCDPPYLKHTRKSESNIYKHEWETKDHFDFLDWALHRKELVLISHYENTLYDEALALWSKHTFTSMTRNGPVQECVYYNFDKPEILQDYSYVGDNFTRRQQLKRISDRLISKLDKMDNLERNFILDSIYNTYNDQF